MKCLFVFSFIVLYIGYVLGQDKKYTDKYDTIDIDEILRNQRLYNNYLDCLTNNGKCTPDGKALKESLPDALSTACSRCTEKQKSGSEKVIKFLIDNRPDDFAKLEKLYDPEGVYKKKYQKEAKQYGIPTQ